MYIILGGTGHVGSAVAEALVYKGERVTVVTHNPDRQLEHAKRGVEIAVADVHDTESLRQVFSRGKRLFLLNPPADPSTDIDSEEKKAIKSTVSALENSGLEKIVAQSTCGAQACDSCGDLGVLHEMEKSLELQPIPTTIIRAAYYMSNWEMALETATNDGVVYSFFPADLTLPMVAPNDLGIAAAKFLSEPNEQAATYYVEGPERYSASDVANAFSAALGKPVQVNCIPRDQLAATFKKFGFSDPAAESYAGMTGKVIDGETMPTQTPVRGETTLHNYISALVAQAQVA